jgi:hypothetical protein
MAHCVKLDMAHVLFSDETGADAPTGDGHAALIKKHKLKVFFTLKTAVDPTTWSSIYPDDDLEEDDENRINFDPVKLYAAFKKHASGAASHTAGPKLILDQQTWKWPEHGTYKDQVVTAFADMRNLRNRSIHLASDDYKLSQPMLMTYLRSKLPSALNIHEPRYRAITTFTDMLVEMGHDADLLDAQSGNTLETPLVFTTRTSGADVDVNDGADHACTQCGHKAGGVTRKQPSTTHPCKICGSPTHWMRHCPRVTDVDATELSAKALITKYPNQLYLSHNPIVNCKMGPDGRYQPV